MKWRRRAGRHHVARKDEALDRLCPHRVECLQLHYDLELCHLGAATDANALRAQRRDWQTRLNTQIQNICLELVVNIFR